MAVGATVFRGARRSAVVNFSNRHTACSRIVNAVEFALHVINSALTYGYVAVFDFKESPNLLIVILAMLLGRVLIAGLGSLAIYVGLRRELA